MLNNQPETAEELIEQQRNISLVENLARYFGKKDKNRLIYVYCYNDVSIIVNDEERNTLVLENNEIVCSNRDFPPIFKSGSWFDSILKLKHQIEQKQVEEEFKKVKNFMFN